MLLPPNREGSALGVKVEGAADQVAGTAGMDHFIREGLKAVRAGDSPTSSERGGPSGRQDG